MSDNICRVLKEQSSSTDLDHFTDVGTLGLLKANVPRNVGQLWLKRGLYPVKE